VKSTPAKKYFTFEELVVRWDRTSNDLVQLVIDGEMVPSLYIPSGGYLLNQFVPIDIEDADSTCSPSPLHDPSIDELDNEVRGWVTGFRYLILPQRTDSHDCDFHYFAAAPLDRDHGALCYSLEHRVGIADVLKSGMVMADEVARVEAKSSEKPAPDSNEKALSTTERNTLLKLVIGMAVKGYSYDPEASKSGVPKEIVDDLANLGIAITDDTVRRYLKEAARTVLSGQARHS